MEARVSEAMMTERPAARLTPSDVANNESRRIEPRAADRGARRRCPFCYGKIEVDARKCRHCGEWVVRTSRGAAAAMLRFFGWCWTGGSLLAAALLWHVATLWQARQVLGGDDTNLPPAVLSALVYGGVAFVAIQGIVLGLGLVVFGGIAPRRPR